MEMELRCASYLLLLTGRARSFQHIQVSTRTTKHDFYITRTGARSGFSCFLPFARTRRGHPITFRDLIHLYVSVLFKTG